MTTRSLTQNRAVIWLAVLVVFVVLMLLASALTSGDKIQGVAWIVLVAISIIGIFVVYFATARSDAWVVGTRQVVYMAIGAALYGVFNYIFNTIPMPSVSQVALRPSICIPIFFGFAFGPVVGFFTGAVGNILGDFLTGWGVFPVWDMGNGLLGLVPGLIMLFADKKRSLNFLTGLVAALIVIAVILIFANPQVTGPFSGELEDFSFWAWAFIIGGVVVIAGRFILERISVDLAAINLWGTLGIIIGIGFAAVADIWVNGYSFGTAIIGEFAPAAGPNILNSMILSPILLAAYQAIQGRTGR